MNIVKSKPLISIIIPAYNCRDTIEETLDSVLKQSLQDFEVIIIDDDSNDDTYNMISDYILDYPNFSLYKNRNNLGVAETRNKGFDLAQGEYIALLDADDVWLPTKLQKQYELFESSNCDVVYTSYKMFQNDDSTIQKQYITKTFVTYEDMLKENYIGCSTVMLKSQICTQYKMNADVYHEDYAYWLLLLRKKIMFLGLNEVLVNYRIIESARSHNKINALYHRLKIYIVNENIGIIYSVYLLFTYILRGLKKYKWEK